MAGILKTRFQIFIFFLLFLPLVAQCDVNYRKIFWKSIGYNQGDAVNSVSRGFLNFEGANFVPENGYLPMYFEKIQIDNPQISPPTLSNEVFEPLSENESALIKSNIFISTEIKLKTVVGYEKKQTYSLISFIPIRKNPLNGKLEKLISFNLNWTGNTISQKTSLIQNSQRNFTANSVLSSGNWYKIGVTQNGIHKLSYAFLKKLGLDVSLLNPKNIRIYGNGGGMLPFANSSTRWDDLRENAILVHGEENQILDSSDYVLFYGENPHVWKYDATDKRFHHQVNLYSDTTYYFINADIGSGKRVGIQSSSSQSVTDFVSTFDDYAFHENDAVNLLKSGVEWYGEYFDIVTSYPFNFYFSNLVSTSPVYVKAGLVARNTSTSMFNVSDGSSVMALSVPGFSPQDFSGGDVISASDTFSFSTSTPSVTLTVSKLTGSSVGWLNYLEVNARRVLKMAGDQLIFRDIQSVGPGNVSQFNVMGGKSTQIWEITDPSNIHSQNTIVSGNDCQFSLSTDSLRTFCAFSDNSYYTPKFFGKIANQNLHGLAQSDLIIVTHPDFINQANALAEYHHSKDGMSVSVATTNQIYNEFSSGGQDIAAIRDFVKMFYDRAASLAQQPKYLLLFGDGSYDNKKRLAGNTNFVPTFQSKNSTVNSSSYVSDDFYGLLDDNEGNSDVNDLVDIGIGRLPVQSVNEAQGGVNKIIKYASSYGDWRNVICFVADDQGQGTPGGDGNTFVDQADGHAGFIQGKYKDYNIDKIYCDAYQQVSAPGGQRYPDVNEAISRRLEKGALIINYTGHGGETGWAHEEIIDVPRINNLKNINNLPLFVTATCEFSRFDDPSRTSAGEYVLLNPNGGGIALLTTVRLVFGSFNATLNTKFYQHAFEPINGEMPRLGDLYRLVKGANAPVENNRKFVLLGDPALRLAYPNYDVVTTSVNGKTIDVNSSDTLKALDIVNVTGHLSDKQGNKLSNFNGTIYPSVFDKNLNIKTLTNDGGGAPFPFTMRKNILYKGRVSVNNGAFAFSFVIPSGISKEYGIGRISYYGENGHDDASGYYENIIIGGTSNNAAVDKNGPEIELFMNDDKFVYGGMTDENPELLAHVKDSSGINRSGVDIGHDLSAVLDENTRKEINLNDYYQADMNSYKTGKIHYPFSKLTEGKHSLKVKVWDVYNNSSQVYTEFVVAKTALLALSHVLNYPNPFTNKTKFFFEHNQASEGLEVQIQIFTVSGKLVKTINTYVNTEGFRAEPIDWDGRDEFGDKIGRGVYLYRLKVHSIAGSTADKFEKLVILN